MLGEKLETKDREKMQNEISDAQERTPEDVVKEQWAEKAFASLESHSVAEQSMG